MTDAKKTSGDGAYFSPSSLSFIPESWRTDGSYSASNWPADAVLLNKSEADKFWRQEPPKGKILGSLKGLPAWVNSPDPEPLSAIKIEAMRLRAYADPLTGSDRLFSESTRMKIMGENGHEEVRARAIARFEEIQAQYPWPVK